MVKLVEPSFLPMKFAIAQSLTGLGPPSAAIYSGFLASSVYIERPPIESLCQETLSQPGSLIRLKAPTLMGKTALINHVLAQMTQKGYHSASLNFALADQSVHFKSFNRFARWFCSTLSRKLNLADQLDQYWDEELFGAKVSCSVYLEEYLLPQAKAPIVLGLDDIELLFPFPEIYTDFFSLLRTWHEKAKSVPIWQQLRLVLAYTTDSYIELDINQSPFNVGVPLELNDFTPEQAQQFAQQFHVGHRIEDVQVLLNLVGGHPYLLEQAFTQLQELSYLSLENLLDEATTEGGIYYSHLKTLQIILEKHPSLKEALKAIATASTPLTIDSTTAAQLQHMGLVKFLDTQVIPRCELYRQYFATHL
jgi:AAA-like domain